MRESQGSFADRYALERELGRGGMATVWLARDLRHERQVAIKILHPELAGAIGVDRFVREVRLTARLSHPGVVPLLDSGILQPGDGTSQPWFVMPYLEGESLRARLEREQQLPVEEALAITAAVGDALSAAHREGVVHRDIKPENVLLAAGRVWVVDFGIAKALADTEAERLTSTGLAIGTPAYMSPEQCSAERVDARSDQYSLATMLYEMLTGEPPFTGPTAQAITARRLTEPARPLLAVRSTVPVGVERAVLRALERVPADRFPDVAAFLAALRAPAAAPAARVGRRPLLGAALVVVLGLAGWLLLRPHGRGAGSRDPETVALYHRGVAGYDQRTMSSLVEGIAAFRAAIGRDSGYALAWSGLAKAYLRAEERGFAIPGMTGDSLLKAAVVAVDRALALDSSNADAWLSRAIVSLRVDPTDQRPAARSLARALALDSTLTPAWHFQARIHFESNGDLGAAIEDWRRAVRLDPKYTQGLAFLALGFYWRRQYDSAAKWADSAIAVDPNYVLSRSTAGGIAVERGEYDHARDAYEAARRLQSGVGIVESLAGIALTEARAGRPREARQLLARIDTMVGNSAAAPPLHTVVYIASAWAGLHDAARTVGWLRRYDRPRDLHFQLHIRCDPPFAPVQAAPAFQALLLPIPGGAGGRGC